MFANAFAQTTVNSPTTEFINRYTKTYKDLNLGHELDLSYVKHIQNLLKNTDIERERLAFDDLARQFKGVNIHGENKCQNLQLQQIAFELELHQQKLALLTRYMALGKQAVLSEQGLAHTSLGKEWYAYLRKAWLTMDNKPEDLMAMGYAELELALTRYRTLQERMGFAGKDQDFATYLNSAEFRFPDGTTPQKDYETRQAIVYQNLHKLFFPTSIQAPQIQESSLGAAMPADGYYEPDEGVFYFNKAKPSYERRTIDWLLMHESTPGHHYQNRYGKLGRGCAADLPHGFYSAFAEGWGAYVEEFGAELGLFQSDADALGAVEWNLVRSIRVVLDVGINYFDWSEQQARDFWQSKLPMLPDLAEREIKRVRNWPVQAMTYKQGSVMLRQLRSKAQAKEGKQFDIRQFHDTVLRNGPVPLQMLDEMVQNPAPMK